MKKTLLVLVTVLLATYSFAQNVGIGTNLPNSSAKLDITSTNSGLLIPRVALTSITDVATIVSPATSLLVYNTNAAMTGGSVGYFYWNGAIWIKLITSASSTNVQNGINLNTTAPNASASNPFVELGGNLIRNTTITHGANNLIFDLNSTGGFRINHVNTTVATSTSYPFIITRSNILDYTAGSDATFVYNQSWSKPLLLNSQGNFVGINLTTAPIQNLDVNGRINVNNGVIQRGSVAITSTNDLGLYSQLSGNWMRIASNAAPIKFYTDQGGGNSPGTNAIVNIDNANGGGVKIAAQTGGGLNAATPDANAVLDLQSTNKGFLFPRMTTAQRDAIIAPSQGLTIYNTDTQCQEWWDVSLSGTSKWNSLCRYCEHQVYISANQANLNVASYIASQGVPLGAFNYCLIINAGVTINALVQSGNAMDFTTLPSGARVYIQNYGRIVGGGGNGGMAGAQGNVTTCSSQNNNGGNGGNGGHAMVTAPGVFISVTNYGLIAGGGGGGGGGDAGCCSAGGGGGGGAGIPVGLGGVGRCSQCAGATLCLGCTGNTCSSAGNNGNAPVGVANAIGGTGGTFANENSPCGTGFNGNNGGNGGSLAGNGGSPADLGCGGCPDCRTPGIGGAAGKSISGGMGNQIVNSGGGQFYGSVD